MVQKQERLYIPKSEDYDEDVYEEDRDGIYYVESRIEAIRRISKLRKVTPQTMVNLFTTEKEAGYNPYRIPLERGKLTLKRPSMDNFLTSAKIIEGTNPAVYEWIYHETDRSFEHYRKENYRKPGYKNYVSTGMDNFRDEIAIPPVIFFKFDYRILAFSEKDNLVMGLAKIGKATGYYMSGNEYILDDNEPPFPTLILTAQSSQDLDTLEEKLGLVE